MRAESHMRGNRDVRSGRHLRWTDVYWIHHMSWDVHLC
jgi:hypothetical protein